MYSAIVAVLTLFELQSVIILDLTAKLRALTLSIWEFPFNSSSLPDGLNTSDRPDWSVVYRNGSQNVTQALRWVSNSNIRLLEKDFN